MANNGDPKNVTDQVPPADGSANAGQATPDPAAQAADSPAPVADAPVVEEAPAPATPVADAPVVEEASAPATPAADAPVELPTGDEDDDELPEPPPAVVDLTGDDDEEDGGVLASAAPAAAASASPPAAPRRATTVAPAAAVASAPMAPAPVAPAPAGVRARLGAAAAALRGGGAAPAVAPAPAAAPTSSGFRFTPVRWVMGAVALTFACVLLWTVLGLLFYRPTVTAFYAGIFSDVTGRTPAEAVEAVKSTAAQAPVIDPAKAAADRSAIDAIRPTIDALKPLVGQAQASLADLLAKDGNGARASLHFAQELAELKGQKPQADRQTLEGLHQQLDNLERQAGTDGASTAIRAVSRKVTDLREELEAFNTRFANRLSAFSATLAAHRAATPTVDPVAEKAARDAEAAAMAEAAQRAEWLRKEAEARPFIGTFVSPQYGYSTELRLDDQGNLVGVYVVSNDPAHFKPGDATFRKVERIVGRTAYGEHVFTDGRRISWRPCSVTANPDGSLTFEVVIRPGEANDGIAPWTLIRQ